MKQVLEEFRVGRWERLPAVFANWKEADQFLERLREIYPLRDYRIVPVVEQPPGNAA
jgi:hypothetical protein